MENNTIIQEQTVDTQNIQPKKKKCKLAKIIIPIVAVLAIMGIMAGVFFKDIKGIALQNFGTPQEYFEFIEKNSASAYSKKLSSAFGEYKNAEKTDSATQVNMDIKLGDEIITLLEKEAGAGLDFDWLKKISINTLLNNSGDKSLVEMMLMLSDTEMVGVKTIVDNKKQHVYMSLPNLIDKYTISENEEGDTKDASRLINNEEFNKILPEEEEVKELIDKYFALLIDNIEGIEKTKEKIKIEGIEQELTVLKTVIEKEEIVQITENLLNELGKDETIKKYIEDISAFLKEEGYIKKNKDVYEDYQDGLADALKELKKDKTIKPLTVITYVDSRHNVVGREIEEDDVKLGYLTVKKGKDVAVCVVLDEVKITGKGTRENKAFNANFTIENDNKELLEVILSLDSAKIKDGLLNGRATLNFLDEAQKQVMKNFNMDISDYSVEIVFSSQQEIATQTISLNDENGELINIKLETQPVEPKEIELPNINDVVSNEEFGEYADFTKLIDALREAGAPSVLVDALEQNFSYY